MKTTVRDRAYGARPLRRAIQKQVEDPLAELMVAQDSVPSGSVCFDVVEDKLVPEFSAASTTAMEAQLAGAKG